MEAWKGLRKAKVVLEEEGGWIVEEDRMMTVTEDMNDSNEDKKTEIEFNDEERGAKKDKDDHKIDDERIVNECVKRNENRDEVDARETKDDLDEERMECKGVKGFERVDEEEGVVMHKDENGEDLKNDDSGRRGQGDNDEMKSYEMIVV